MNYKEVFELKDGLDSVSNLQGVKFALTIAKNIILINREIEVFKKALKYTPEEIDLIQKSEVYKHKDNKKYVEFVKQNKVELLKIRKKEHEYLSEEVDIILHKIDEKDLPQDITAEQIIKINSIINV